jgi:hypothetical protein
MTTLFTTWQPRKHDNAPWQRWTFATCDKLWLLVTCMTTWPTMPGMTTPEQHDNWYSPMNNPVITWQRYYNDTTDMMVTTWQHDQHDDNMTTWQHETEPWQYDNMTTWQSMNQHDRYDGMTTILQHDNDYYNVTTWASDTYSSRA